MTGLFGFCSSRPDASGAEGASRLREGLTRTTRERVEFDACDSQVAVGQVSRAQQHTPGARWSQDGRVAVWLCGDVFDGARREHGSTSQALALDQYLRLGIEGLTRLDGEFTVAVWDERLRELVLVNDRFGLHPHFFVQRAGCFAFAPRVRPLADVLGRRRAPDRTAIGQFLRFQQLLGERTWLEGVRELSPAYALRWDATSGTVSTTSYWSWADIHQVGPVTFDEAVAEGTRLLERAVERRCLGEERIGVFLSGGLDSRILAGLAAERRRVHTFTFGHDECRDVVYAARLARVSGTVHHHEGFVDGRWVQAVAPQHLRLTEGQHSFIHAHGMTSLREAGALVDVNLTGWDGGTILRGRLEEYDQHLQYRACADEGVLERRLFEAFCSRFTWPGLNDAELDALLASGGRDLAGLARSSFAEEFGRTAGVTAHRRGDYFYARHHLLRSTINMVVFGRSALKVRCPYFDRDFFAFMYGLPDEIWATPRFTRAVITRRLPRLARIPGEADLRLPHESRVVRGGHALLRRSMGWVNRHVARVFPERTRPYADYENYLRHELRPWAEHLLFHERTLSRGFYDVEALRALWARHASGRELHTIGKIVPVMAIEMALRYLVDGDTPEQGCGLDEASRAQWETAGARPSPDSVTA